MDLVHREEEGILMCSIFFDYDFVYGGKALVDAITGYFKM
jgi:signal-transduction protein with cAMP-binding, CBS, and nucleotidyltransferase domain